MQKDAFLSWFLWIIDGQPWLGFNLFYSPSFLLLGWKIGTDKNFICTAVRCAIFRLFILMRDRCYDFLNIFATKNRRKNWRLRLKTKLNYEKIWSLYWFLRKTPQKIVIIILTRLGELSPNRWLFTYVPWLVFKNNPTFSPTLFRLQQLCIKLNTNWVVLYFERFFYKTHLVALCETSRLQCGQTFGPKKWRKIAPIHFDKNVFKI
jgi:hypothetical protein